MNSKLRLVLKTSTIALAVLSAATCPVLAQQAPPTKQSQSLELESVQQDIENTKRRQQELLAEIKALDRDVGAINRALIESAKRGQALETHISKVEVNNMLGKVDKKVYPKLINGLVDEQERLEDLRTETLGEIDNLDKILLKFPSLL